MQRLFEQMERLLSHTPTTFIRYPYEQINWDNHMLGLVGPRGVGKTTLFLQRITQAHDTSNALYVTADNLYFANHRLYDTADEFQKHGGTHLFIDEVHKYPGWSRELKAMYDSFPGLSIYFTGSSVLDIEKGESDLSRRAPRYLMQGLSFREWLALNHGILMEPLSLDDILDQKAQIDGVEHPLPLFEEYLRTGYYPFGTDPDFDIELQQVVTRTLEVDIPEFANMSAATGRKLKQMMATVSTLAPFKPNMTELARLVGVSRNNIAEYLSYMEKAGMIAQLKTGARGIGSLAKVEKVYLDNPNLINVLCAAPQTGTIRETFFFNQMRVNHQVTASATVDFHIEDYDFEVGGKNKGRDQLKGTKNGYVVKDDIERGYGNILPLWAFGLTY